MVSSVFFVKNTRLGMNPPTNCNHKPIAKWFLRCMQPDIFPATSDSFPSTFSFLDSDAECSKIIQYQLEEKQIPFDIPTIAMIEKFPPGQVFVATEVFCIQCNEKLCLKECKGDAKLLTRFGFVNLCNIWMKSCSSCALNYPYSEITDGVFNFNNKFFKSYDLLNWLRNAIFEIALSIVLGKPHFFGDGIIYVFRNISVDDLYT